MSLPVFIHPNLADAAVGGQVVLTGAEGRHAVTVKRIEIGEQVSLIDGSGLLVTVTVTDTRGKDELVGVVQTIDAQPEPSPRVVVVQAIPKSERAELAVDLATQAGADEIVAWQADRCVARWDAKKAPKALAKWEAAAASAAKQSRRRRIPVVRGPVTTGQLVEELARAAQEKTGEAESTQVRALVLHEDATASVKDVDLSGVVYLIVGPEGGIGRDELGRLERVGATAIRLGPEVLRTASAAMVALAAIGVRTQRW